MLFAKYQNLFSSEILDCLSFHEVLESLKEIDEKEDIIAFTYSSLFHECTRLSDVEYKISYTVHVVTLNEVYTVSLECENIKLNSYLNFINDIQNLINELSKKNGLTILNASNDAAIIGKKLVKDNYSAHPGSIKISSIVSMQYNIINNKSGTEKYIITLNDERKTQMLIYKSDAMDLFDELEKLGRFDLLLGQ